jgi:hypothetical protein
MDIISLSISRDQLEAFYEAIDESIYAGHYGVEYLGALNAIELALGKERTEVEDEDESGDLDG